MYNLLFGGRPRGSKNRTRSFRRRSVSKRRASKKSKPVASRVARRRRALKKHEGARKMSRKGKSMIHHGAKWYSTFASPSGEYIYKGAAKKGSRRVKHRVNSIFA